MQSIPPPNRPIYPKLLEARDPVSFSSPEPTSSTLSCSNTGGEDMGNIFFGADFPHISSTFTGGSPWMLVDHENRSPALGLAVSVDIPATEACPPRGGDDVKRHNTPRSPSKTTPIAPKLVPHRRSLAPDISAVDRRNPSPLYKPTPSKELLEIRRRLVLELFKVHGLFPSG